MEKHLRFQLLTSSLQFVPPVGRTGLETQWVSPQERSEKSLRDFERLRSGVDILRSTGASILLV